MLIVTRISFQPYIHNVYIRVMYSLQRERNMMTVLQQITCDAKCWDAKEPECNCSCNGKNHGSIRREQTHFESFLPGVLTA